MVDLNAHEAGNGGKKPREAYSPPSLLYSENACLSRRRPRVRVPSPLLLPAAFAPFERAHRAHPVGPCECSFRFTLPCGLSSPFFGRSVSFSEMLFFSLWVGL
jgi:hypothetical protein